MTSEKHCPCGGVILADTEDWKVPLCHECWLPLTRIDIPSLLELSIMTFKRMRELESEYQTLIKELSE